ncbi:hydantoinase/oxoprolinase family protein [soil metagenome]
MQNGGFRAGIDIGGTFTDILLFDEDAGIFTIGKTLTTPGDPSDGVMNAIAEVSEQTGISLSDISQIVHGTTLVTNALIERKGAKTALITTKGFRDALEIGREHRYDLYDLMIQLPAPLVPRRLRLELDERLHSDGSVIRPPSREATSTLVQSLANQDIEAVAVCLIHSYVNDRHEQMVGEVLASEAPGLVVSLSSDVAPEIREYERTSTTVANVYVRPLTERYLARLVESFHDAGFTGSVYIMLSSGGLCTVEAARRYPIRLVESGPAAGALAAAHLGKLSGRNALLSFDMGGTTAKCCLIGEDGPSHSAEFEVGRVYRFKQGSGLPVSVPVIELIEIGAGGGSIARIDNMGLLKVGPDSAGADPGPACYDRGGSQATVTDADLVLGYLDPDHFLGGSMPLKVDAARSVIAALGNQLEMTEEQTAWGIHQIVNEQMAGAARIHAIERGEDARMFPLFAFGGAGPGHAFRVAEILRSPEVIVPFGAGVASTIGFLVAPIAFDYVRTLAGRLADLDWAKVNTKFDEMSTEGIATVSSAGASSEVVTIHRFAEMRYVGQGHQVRVEIPNRNLDASTIPDLIAIFEATYQRLYGRTAPGNLIEAVNWRVVASAPAPELPLVGFGFASGPGSHEHAQRGSRQIYLPESGSFETVPVFDRYAMDPKFTRQGPMIIEERESTIVVGPAANVHVDAFSNVVITMPAGG